MIRSVPASRRTDVRCTRCARIQPPLPAGIYHCLYCGTALPLQRWVAHPPPPLAGQAPPRRGRIVGRERPYGGPPSYRGAHPRWGFAPAPFHWIDPPDPDAGHEPPVTALRTAAVAALATATFCLIAAAAEIWRFALMLRGRTDVLSGTQVRVSDVLVTLGAWAAMGGALLTAALAVPAICRAHRAAAIRAGLADSRDQRSMLLRLLVPVWNIHGAGQVCAEIDGLLCGSLSPGSRPRPSRTLLAWWACWAGSSVLVIIVLARGLGASLQAVADTVELHIAVDLAAGAVTALGALVLLRWARAFAGPRRTRYASWTVAGPEPTRPRPTDPAPEQSDVAAEAS